LVIVIAGRPGIRRAQVEAAAAVDRDRIEETAAQRFDPGDRAAAGGDIFLHQQHAVDAVGDAAVGDRGAERLEAVVAHDPRARPADVRLDHDREAQVARRRDQIGGAVDNARRRDRQAQPRDQ
jgi:hypothetical protein